MLSLESRESNDNRSLGELFLYFSDEMSDITWIQAFQMLLQMFRTMLSDNTELSDEKINELTNAFMDALPTMIGTRSSFINTGMPSLCAWSARDHAHNDPVDSGKVNCAGIVE